MSHAKLDALPKLASSAERPGMAPPRSNSQQPAFGEHLNRASVDGARRERPAPVSEQERPGPPANPKGLQSPAVASSPTQSADAESRQPPAESQTPEHNEAPAKEEHAYKQQVAEHVADHATGLMLEKVAEATESGENVELVEADETVISVETATKVAESAVVQIPEEASQHTEPADVIKSAMPESVSPSEAKPKKSSQVAAPTPAMDVDKAATESRRQLTPTRSEPVPSEIASLASSTEPMPQSEARNAADARTVSFNQQESFVQKEPQILTESDPSFTALQGTNFSETAPQRVEPSPARTRNGKSSSSNRAQRDENDATACRTAMANAANASSGNHAAPTSTTSLVAAALAPITILDDAASSETQQLKRAAVKTDGTSNPGTRLPAGLEPGRAKRASEEDEAGPRVDAARFVGRVARAFQAAHERGGTLHLRLSPPELGSLRLELSVQEGVMTATLETEHAAARRILLEHLPMLRERLAEQNIRIERFDVDVRREDGGSATHDHMAQHRQHRHEPGDAPPRRELVASAPGEEPIQPPLPINHISSPALGINLVA